MAAIPLPSRSATRLASITSRARPTACRSRGWPPRRPRSARPLPARREFPLALVLVIPGWSEGPDLRCAIAHWGISRFRVRVFDAPRNDMEKIAPAKIFFIIFVDGIFTTLFGWLFTNVFD